MWLTSLAIGVYAAIVLCIFCLNSAGRRADEGEEKVLELISPVSSDDMEEDTSIQASRYVQVSGNSNEL